MAGNQNFSFSFIKRKIPNTPPKNLFGDRFILARFKFVSGNASAEFQIHRVQKNSCLKTKQGPVDIPHTCQACFALNF